MLQKVYQTASEVELTDHLGYEKNSSSDNPNHRNGYNNKALKSKYKNINVSILRDRDGSFLLRFIRNCKRKRHN